MRLLNLQTVLAAVDVEPSSDATLESATRLAKTRCKAARRSCPATGGSEKGARQVARRINGVRSSTIQAEVKRLAERLDRWSCVGLRATVRRNADVVAAIAGFAGDQKADLVVLGSRGLGLDEAARLGSVSAGILARLEIPMLLVPPAVWRAHAAVACS